MKTKGLIILAGLTIVALATTSAILRTNPSRIVSDRRGEVVFPELASAGGDISLIDIQDGDRSIAIERKDNGFVAAGSKYPVKIEPLRDLVATLANLRFEEAKTADPARYSDLGLGEPGSKGEAGKLVTIKKQSGAVLASVLVGNRDASVGGPQGGTYAKLFDAAQSYLLRGEVKIPGMKADWFDANLAKVDREAIAKIELLGGGRDAITLVSSEAGKELELTNVPEAREADPSNLSRVISLIESLDFQDVRKATQTKSEQPRKLIAQTRQGLRLELTLIGEVGDSWFSIAASSTNESAAAQAKEIAAKVEGREFRLPGYQGDLFGWSMNEVTIERKSAG